MSHHKMSFVKALSLYDSRVSNLLPFTSSVYQSKIHRFNRATPLFTGGSYRRFCNNTVQESSGLLVTSSPHQTFKVFQSTASSSTEKDSQTTSGKDDAAESSSNQPQENVAKLKEAISELQAKHDNILDKYRRSIAENDNMRKRLTKQIDDAKIFGIQSFCKDLLDVADVLKKAVAAGEGENKSGLNKDMFEGLKLTESQLLQVFRRHGLEQVNPINEKFDPNKHEALFQIPNPNVDVNTVLDVQKIGYQLHGRTIRPALVGVSKK